MSAVSNTPCPLRPQPPRRIGPAPAPAFRAGRRSSAARVCGADFGSGCRTTGLGAGRRPASSAVSGVAAVELALLLVPLLLILLGVAEFGRAIHTFNTLDKSVRDAARHLSQHGPGDAVVWAQARCLAVHGDAGCQGAPLATGLGTALVVVCDAVACPSTHANQATGEGVVNLVSVTIEGYVFDSLPDLQLPGVGTVFGDRSLRAIGATMRGPL